MIFPEVNLSKKVIYSITLYWAPGTVCIAVNKTDKIPCSYFCWEKHHNTVKIWYCYIVIKTREKDYNFLVNCPGTILVRNDILVERPVGGREQASIPGRIQEAGSWMCPSYTRNNKAAIRAGWRSRKNELYWGERERLSDHVKLCKSL